MPDIVGCPTAAEILAALDTISKAEKFLLARATKAGLPVSYVSIDRTGSGHMGISIDCYGNRVFMGSLSKRRDTTRERVHSFGEFDRVVDEAAAAFKAKKQR